LGKELPAGEKYLDRTILPSHSSRPGWENDVNKIIEKCHKNTYNYCIKATREKVGECVKSEAMAMIVSHDFTPSLFTSVLLTLACAAEVRLAGTGILSLRGKDSLGVALKARGKGYETDFQSLRNEWKEVLAIL
jgi:hypothetical protein